MPINEAELEAEIQQKGLTAPRVTPEQVDDQIVGQYFFRAADAINAGGHGGAVPVTDGLKTLTICILVLRNGFTLIGESNCASPENFDAEIGRKLARENARNKIWQLEGYALRSKLAEGRA